MASVLCGPLVLLAAACGASATPARPTAAGPPADARIEGEIVVFAASSLTEAFKEAGARFETLHPGTSVRFNFAASSALATQIDEGAPADVFASADEPQMEAVIRAGNAMDSRVFATNLPVIVAPKGTDEVAALADLARPGLRLVLAAPEVPIGRYSRKILANASGPGGIGADFADSVLANLKSNEANARGVLAKVQLGEADAGIVYETDAAAAAGDVTVIEIPAAFNVVARYPIAALTSAREPSLANAWVEFVLGPEGQAILASNGLGKAGSS